MQASSLPYNALLRCERGVIVGEKTGLIACMDCAKWREYVQLKCMNK